MPTVLIVASDPLLHEGLQTTLMAAGYATMITTDGLVGLTQARIQRPAVIVMDLLLPIIDGPTAVQLLRRIPTTREIPIVALSLPEGLPPAVQDLPQVEVLFKPFALDDFLQVVTTLAPPTTMSQFLSA